MSSEGLLQVKLIWRKYNLDRDDGLILRSLKNEISKASLNKLHLATVARLLIIGRLKNTCAKPIVKDDINRCYDK
jgi:hypothetical protein